MGERIIIDIDTTQLEIALAFLGDVDVNLGKVNSKLGTGGGATGAGSEGLAKGLPSINRELRILLGNVPGMREAMSKYFVLRRAFTRYNLALEGGGAIGLYLVLISTAIMIFRTLKNARDESDRQKKEYEKMIRQARDISKSEFLAVQKQWEERSRYWYYYV